MVGSLLHEARQARGYSLDDVERATRIRAKYLEAIEADDFSRLASPAQARGFVLSYARFLGLDEAETLERYAETIGRRALASRGFNSRPPAPASAASLPPVRRSWRRIFSLELWLTVILVLAFAALLAWGGLQLAAVLAAPSVTATPSLTPTASLTPTLTPPPVEASPTAPLPTPLPVYTGVNVLVRAEQRLWLRVQIDGAEVFAGLMRPGQTREFAGLNLVELTTGNAAGARVVWNGQDQGTLGGFGEVVTRLWTPGGMIFPTATPPPAETPAP